MKTFRILVATDGSPSARAALETAIAFPWPEPCNARAVVALGGLPRLSGGLRAQVTRALLAHADEAQRLLSRRWKNADAVVLHEAPAKAILGEARRFGGAAAPSCLQA